MFGDNSHFCNTLFLDNSLKTTFSGIPCLVVLGPDLDIVNPNARNRVSNDLEAAEFPWGAKVITIKLLNLKKLMFT